MGSSVMGEDRSGGEARRIFRGTRLSSTEDWPTVPLVLTPGNIAHRRVRRVIPALEARGWKIRIIRDTLELGWTRALHGH